MLEAPGVAVLGYDIASPMDPKTRTALNAINQRFYREVAQEFSDTRHRGWPGWERAIAGTESTEPLRVLDVGCGNGRFVGFMLEQGRGVSRYIGVDSSEGLLAIARERFSTLAPSAFQTCDFVEDCTDLPRGPFDLAVVFGVLHHIPGFDGRRALLTEVSSRVAPGGRLAVTRWSFDQRERVARRGLPWEEYRTPNGESLHLSDLEPGDFLLRWRDEPGRVRFVHLVEDPEWARLIEGLPLEVVSSYEADGRSGADNRYTLLRRTEPAPARASSKID